MLRVILIFLLLNYELDNLTQKHNPRQIFS